MLKQPVAHKSALSLDTAHLRVRILTPQDATPAYVSGLNDPRVNRYLEARLMRHTLESVQNYIREKEHSTSDYFFGLWERDGALIGSLLISHVSNYHAFAALGICLFDSTKWGRGWGAEAVNAVTSLCFEQLGLHYVEAGCYESNLASQKLFTKCGFSLTARYPEKYRLENHFEPVLILSRTNPLYKGKKEDLHG